MDQQNKTTWEKLRSERRKDLQAQGYSDKEIQDIVNLEFSSDITQRAIAEAQANQNRAGALGERINAHNALAESLLERRQQLIASAEEGMRGARVMEARQRYKKLILGWLAIALGILDVLMLIGRVKRVFG